MSISAQNKPLADPAQAAFWKQKEERFMAECELLQSGRVSPEDMQRRNSLFPDAAQHRRLPNPHFDF